MNKKFGHYEVQCELGRGGMGVVYKAWEPSLNRHVAIKVLGEHLLADEAVRERFVREAKSMAALNSPNIIQIHYIGEEEGRPYFAMEYIEGQSLSDLLKDNKVLSVEHAREILRQSCKGLGAAHEAGVIHRDIKPANIMITREGLVKIADFGIARTRELGDKLTNTGEFVGTPGYLSPEVCIGQDVDARADIFSLGIVFYEMLAGAMPFTNESPLGLMLEVVQAEIPDIRQINKQVDRKTSQVLQKMIAKSVTDRYQQCAEIIADLGPAKSQLNLKQIEAQRQVASVSTQARTTGIPTGDIPTAPALAALTGGHTQLAPAPAARKKGRGARWLAAATLFVVVGAAATGYYTGYLPMPFKGQSQPTVMLAGDNLTDPQVASHTQTPEKANPSGTPTPASTQTAEKDAPSPLFSGLMGVMNGKTPQHTATNGDAEGNTNKAQNAPEGALAAEAAGSIASMSETNPNGADLAPGNALAQNDVSETNDFAIDIAPRQTQVNLLPAKQTDSSPQTGQNEPQGSVGINKATQNRQASLANPPQPLAELMTTQTTPSRRIQLPAANAIQSVAAKVKPAQLKAQASQVLPATATTHAPVKKQAKKTALPLNNGVVVLVFGDPAVANPIEKTLESQLRANHVKVMNEQFIPGFDKLLTKGADLATLREAIVRNGGQALVVANINPTGSQELSYYGRSSTLNTAQLDVDGYDLRSGETIAGYGNTLSYTALNATEKATEAVMPFVDRLVANVKQKTGKN